MIVRTDHRVLCRIYDGATTLTALRRTTQLSPRALDRCLRRLERQGYILVFETTVALTQSGIDQATGLPPRAQ